MPSVKNVSEEALAYSLAREDLAIFQTLVGRTDDGKAAVPPRHILDIVIPAIEDDSLGHTLIVAPPGSIKTNTMMGACEWWLGRNPHQHMAYICDAAPRAEERSVAVRTVISESPEYKAIFPEVEPDPKRGWAQNSWYLQRPNRGDKNATFLAAGMDSSILGARLERIVLDDIWNEKIANSPTEKMRAFGKLEKEIMTRLHPTRGRVIGICTRWGEDDFAAWAMERGWHTIHIPAISEGESYWPEYFPRAWLRCENDEHSGQQCCQFRKIGSAAFVQQYLGEVATNDNAIFKPEWWATAVSPESWDRGVIVCDTAGWDPTNIKSDFAAMSAWAKVGEDYHVLEVVEDHLSFVDVKKVLKNLKHTWQMPIVVEDVPWARPLIQDLQKEMSGIIPWKVQGRSKQQRAEAVASIVEAGRVFLPPKASWRERWINQHTMFPNAKNDDLVDNTSMALGYMDRNAGRKRDVRRLLPFTNSWERLSA